MTMIEAFKNHINKNNAPQINKNNAPQKTSDTPLESFQQLGLLVGSFTSWEEDQQSTQLKDFPTQLKNFIEWTQSLPFVNIYKDEYHCLGINAAGFAFIYYTMLQTAQIPDPDDHKKKCEDALLKLKICSSLEDLQDIAKPPDNYKCFQRHISTFAGYIKELTDVSDKVNSHLEAMPPKVYIWLKKDDASWWLQSMTETLEGYLASIKKQELTREAVARLSDWLECSVFVPLDISALPDFDLVKATEVYQAAANTCKGQSWPHTVYLSWDFLPLDKWGDAWREQLFLRTVLSLWTSWSSKMLWTPRLTPEIPSPSFSWNEAECLLTGLLPALRRYFLRIKEAHHLPLTRVVFEKAYDPQKHYPYPPTFYFADPGRRDRRDTTEQYLQNVSVHKLIDTCLRYNTPQSDKLSCMTIERCLSLLRTEVMPANHYKPRYLLIPTAIEQDEKIGLCLKYSAGFLSFLEYTIYLEAEDVFKRADDLNSEKEANIDISETANNFVSSLARLIPTLSQRDLQEGADDFRQFQLLLGRMQYKLGTMRGDASQVERQYEHLVKRTSEFLNEEIRVNIEPVSPRRSLSEALVNAYPYRTLQMPIRTVKDQIEQLKKRSDRVESQMVIFSNLIRNSQEKMEKGIDTNIKIFGTIIAVIALFRSGLDHFGASIPWSSIWNFIVPAILIILTIAIGPVTKWVQHWRAVTDEQKQKIRFFELVQQLWKLAEPPVKDEEMQGRDLENRDQQATGILNQVWANLKKHEAAWKQNETLTRKNVSQHMEEMAVILRRMVYHFSLFVLHVSELPLPRTMCIFYYKSTTFLMKSTATISDNEFRRFLGRAGFTSCQIEALRRWLQQPENKEWIINESVDTVATALANAGIKASPDDGAEKEWQGALWNKIKPEHPLPPGVGPKARAFGE